MANGFQSASGYVMYDVAGLDYGALGDGVTDDTTTLQNYFDYCLSNNKTAFLRQGTYLISSGLTLASSLYMEDGAVIKATATMPAMISLGVTSGNSSGGTRVTNLEITNLTLDCDDLASDGIWFRKHAHIRLVKPTVYNAPRYAVRIGDPATSGAGGYEVLVSNCFMERNKGSIQAGSSCIFIDTDSTDNIVDDGTIKDADIGMIVKTGSNQFSNLHAWANLTYGAMSVCFDDYASNNRWYGNQADTATTYGFHLRASQPILIGNTVYNGPYSPSPIDNVAIGMHFDLGSGGAGATVIGNLFKGSDSSHRLAKDFDITSPTGNLIFGNMATSNVVTPSVAVFAQYQNSTSSLAFTTNTLNFNSGAAAYINGSNAGGLTLGGTGVNGIRVDANGLNVLTSSFVMATTKTPASATATGIAGQICRDANYIYVCTATNSWKRAALSTW